MDDIEILYKKYYKDIFNYLMWLTHDNSLSEDLLQETFLNAILALDSFKGQSDIKTWLISISRNIWKQYIRKNNKELEYNDLLESLVLSDIADQVINQEIKTQIYNIINQMDSKSKKIMTLRFQGFSYLEISINLNISESSTRVIFFRGKNYIKKSLERQEYI